jgi:hypothetical protein
VWRLLVDPDGQVHDVAEALQEPLVPTPDGGGGDPAAEQSPLPYRQQLGAVTAAVDAERFEVGDYLALRLEKQVEADHGRGSAPWVRMREVRAHIAFLHGDFARAAELWIEVALEWVALAQPACWPAARNAHHCWLRIREVDEAVRIGHEVVAMWRQAGRDQQAQRALVHLDRVQIDGP